MIVDISIVTQVASTLALSILSYLTLIAVIDRSLIRQFFVAFQLLLKKP
jgi:hypothetical protein